MNSALIPILYVLTILAWILNSTIEPGARAVPSALLLAPILYQSGMRLRHLLAARFLAQAAPAAVAQVILGTFLLGGILYAFDTIGSGSASLTGRRAFAEALLLGLAISLAGPGLAPWNSRPQLPLAGRSARLGALLEAQVFLMLLMAIPILSTLGFLMVPDRVATGAGSIAVGVFLELLKGLAAGAVAGLLGHFILKILNTELPRSALHLSISETAAVAACFGAGSALLAALTAGFLCAGRTGAEAPFRGERAINLRATRTGRREKDRFAGVDIVNVLAGAGILLLAASFLEPAGVISLLPLAAALWLGSVVFRFLVQFGFGGAFRWFKPADLPTSWLPVLAWGIYPGPAAMGFLLVGLHLRTQSWMEVETTTAQPIAVLLAVIALSLLIQGSTAGVALRRAARVSPKAEVLIWERLKARAISLRAERKALASLRFRGDLDEDSMRAMEEALESAERQVQLEREELSIREPKIKSEELTRAIREVLAAGQEAVREAGDFGLISPEIAVEIEEDLARRRQRSGAVSLHELLGPMPEGQLPRHMQELPDGEE